MNAEAEPRVELIEPTSVGPVDDAISTPIPDPHPGDEHRPPRPNRTQTRFGDPLGRLTFAILFLGTLIVAWKLHMFKVPSQIAAEKASAAGKFLPKTNFFDRILDWLTPWRWGRGDMLKDTLATGGDMGAHVWSADYVHRALFPKFRLTGWSNDWLGGFPVLNFYFPLPTLFISTLAYLIPANIAFKLVTVLGILLLPTTAWLSGRIAQLPRPIPLMMGLIAFPFVFSRHFDLYIYGGNVGSTMAGEFSFSISVALAVLFAGLLVRVLKTGEYRGRAALTLAATGLCHLLPTIWVSCFSVVLIAAHLQRDRMRLRNGSQLGALLIGGGVLAALATVAIDPASGVVVFGGCVFAIALLDLFTGKFGLRQVRDAVLVLGSGGAIASFWLLPFYKNLDYSNDMGWEKMKLYKQNLFPFWGPKPYADSHIIAVAMLFALVGALAAVISLGRAIAVNTERKLGISAATLTGASLCAAAVGLVIGLVRSQPNTGLILGGALLVATFVLALLLEAPLPGQIAAVLGLGATILFLVVKGFTPGHLIVITGIWAMIVLIVAGLKGLEFQRIGMALTLMAGVCVAFFVQTPQFRLWNARALPFWFLTIYLLAAHGAYRGAHAIRSATHAVAIPKRTFPRAPMLGSIVAAFAVFVAVGLPLNLVPDSLPIPKVSKGLIGVQTAGKSGDSNFSPGWALYNYKGYQGAAGWNEYNAVMNKAKEVGKTNGCGRVLWEYEDAKLGSFGTTLSLMLLPYWTKGCLQSFEGVYFESSATMPYHWMTAALITAPLTNDAKGNKKFSGPSNPQRDLPYGQFDLKRGVKKMRDAGVRYYLAFTDAALAAADAMPDELRMVDQVGKCTAAGATPDPNGDGKSCFRFYEIINHSLVSGLSEQPQIVTGIDHDQTGGWLDVEADWYNNPTTYPETIAQEGPKDWQKFGVTLKPKPTGTRTFGVGVTKVKDEFLRKTLPKVNVSNIKLNNTDLTFSVDQIGVPVLVKVSYFPNWEASGAKGPYRVIPNFMVVIPTQKSVHLHYGYSKWDKLGFLATFAGLAMVVLLHRSRRQPLPEPPAESHEVIAPPPPLSPESTAREIVEDHAFTDERELVDAISR